MTPLEHLRAAMADVDAYYKERGIFQGKFGFGKRPALIVIDMAYGWTDPAYAGGSARLDPAIAAIAAAAAGRARKGVPVIYTTSPYLAHDAAIKSAADFSPNFRKWDAAGLRDRRARPPAAGRVHRLQGARQRLRRHAAGRAI